MKGLNNKRTTLIVYGAYPISLDIITTLLSENGSVIVADIYKKEKQNLFKEITNNPSFKFIILEAISKLESVISKIDYIFVLLDQHMDGESLLTSEKYLEILNTLQATLEYAKSTNTKVAITFPLNTYPSNEKIEGQYTITDLHRSITKKISEVTEKNKFVKLIYTGELIGPGMNIATSTPFRDLLIDSIIEEKVSIAGDGLEAYFAVYTSDYVYGLVKSNFSNDAKNVVLSIKEKVSLLSFAYKVIEYNPVIQDIEFTKVVKAKKEVFKPDLSSITPFEVRFTIDETIEKSINYLYTVSEKKKIAKAPPVIAKAKEYPKPDSVKPTKTFRDQEEIEEELTPLGKFVERADKAVTPLKTAATSVKHSWSMFFNNPAKIAVYTVISAVVMLTFYFLIFPVSSLLYNGYRYQASLKNYTLNLLAAETTENSKYLETIEYSNAGIQKAWTRLSYVARIPYTQAVFGEVDKVVLSIAHITQGIVYWDQGITPVIDYITQLEIPELMEYERITTSREYSLELSSIVANSSALTRAQEELYKGVNIIKSVDTSVFPAFMSTTAETIKSIIVENEKYIDGSFTLLTEIPNLVGIDDRVTYIILLENPYELRAQGGWISGYGLLEFEHGQIKVLRFDNIYNLDGIVKNNSLTIAPPADYASSLAQTTTWLPSQSNWSMDYPTMKTELEAMLRTMNVRQDIDGVITLNLFFFEDLLEKTGPIYIESLSDPVTSDNLLLQIVDYHNSFTPGADTKPDILSEIAAESYNALVTNSQTNVIDILDFLTTQLNEKNIIISVDNATIESKLSELGWNNSIQNYSDGFYIYPSEWNYGGNKANAFLTRGIDVNLNSESSILTGSVKLEWRNLSVENSYPQGDYKAIVRVMLPANTIITNVSGVDLYDVSNNETSTIVYLDLNVAIQSVEAITITFSNAHLDYNSVYLVKQPGIYNTVYAIVVETNGETLRDTGEISEDITLPF